MAETWTTYADGEAITWERVNGIARAVKVAREQAAVVLIGKKPLPECAVCTNLVSNYNARYCLACSAARRTVIDRQRSRTGTCLDCGQACSRKADRCWGCSVEARRAA